MNKKQLLGLIEKYNLSGTIESVKWVVQNKKLNVDFVSDDKALVGTSELNEFDFEDAELGIYTTSELIKMLAALEDSVTIEPVKIADKFKTLKISDKTFKMQYVLSEPAIIPPAPVLKKLPEFEVSIRVDKEFIDKFIKAKNAISDAESFAVQSMGDETVFTIGYSDQNTNRTAFKVSCQNRTDIGPLLFGIEYMKNVLVANKDADKGVIEISSKGLMRLQFETKEYKSTYFIVKLQSE